QVPRAVVGGGAWGGGQARAGSARLSNGARWDSAWIQLLDMHEYEESIRLYFADAVRTLAIPSPGRRQSPSVYSITTAGDGGRRTARFESYEEAYQLELVHFHQCMLGAEVRRTPPTRARIDQAVLTEMFRRRGPS